MNEVTRNKLKTYFESGDTPSANQFSDFIDSALNKQDDELFVRGGKVGIGISEPANRLDVSGGLSVGKEFVGGVPIPDNSLSVQGQLAVGTKTPNERLTVDGAISLREQEELPAALEGYGKLYVQKQTLTTLLLEGKHYIDFSDHIDKFKDLSVGTISLWYRPRTSEVKTQSLLWFGTSGEGPTNGLNIGIGPWTSGHPDESMVFFSSSAGEGVSGYIRRGEAFFTENRWYHIAVVMGDDFNKVFIDGVEQSVHYGQGGSDSGGLLFSSLNVDEADAFVLGNRMYEGRAELHTDGYLDEVAVIKIPLSDWDVKALFNEQRRKDIRKRYDQELAGYWRINQALDPKLIKDVSGAEAHGQVIGPIGAGTFESREVQSLRFRTSHGEDIALGGGTVSSGGGHWGQKGQNIYYDQGNVGIGTPDPAAGLHINSGVTTGLEIHDQPKSMGTQNSE